jgi:hypothetical protein
LEADLGLEPTGPSNSVSNPFFIAAEMALPLEPPFLDGNLEAKEGFFYFFKDSMCSPKSTSV